MQSQPTQLVRAGVAAAPYRGEVRGWLSSEAQQAFAAVSDLIDQSRFALELACGLSSQLEVIPATERLPGLHALHVQGFIPMSYHVLTAAGATKTVLRTGPTLPLMVLVIGCVQTTLELGSVIPGSLQQMRMAVTEPYIEAFEASAQWSRQILPPLVQALTIIQELMGPQAWQEVSRERQRVEEAIHRARAGMPYQGENHQASPGPPASGPGEP